MSSIEQAVFAWRLGMTRPVLMVTAFFYVSLGAALLVAPPSRVIVTRGTLEAFAYNHNTQLAFGGVFVFSGILTTLGVIWYHNVTLRIAAAMLRAGSMASLALLLAGLLVFHLRGGSLSSVIIFTYLTVVAVLTSPPPTPPRMQAALNALDNGDTPHEAIQHLQNQ